jgi:hypothetical protein
MNKKCIIIGGGTFNHVRNHLALAAPAFGETARQLAALCQRKFENMDVELVLTKMADHRSAIVTNDDLSEYVDGLVASNLSKVVFFNAAVTDFEGTILERDGARGKHGSRLSSSDYYLMDLAPCTDKIVSKLRKTRKDIFVVAFKTTCNASPEFQYGTALAMLKKNSVNLVLANDVVTRKNFIVTPEEGVIHGTREELLVKLVDMAWARSHLSFTRSTVVEGTPVPWTDPRVPSNLRTVVNRLVELGAYKEFNGATTGHFAAKLGPSHFLTSIRKTNFKNIAEKGMVEVRTQGDDEVIAFGARPSVGGQSQRAIFKAYGDCDCIVHFHCPLLDKPRDDIRVMSQWEYECGSHECGHNTRDGLRPFGNLHAVMLDTHGPNIVFSKEVNPAEVLEFIEANFDLSKPTNGFTEVYL